MRRNQDQDQRRDERQDRQQRDDRQDRQMDEHQDRRELRRQRRIRTQVTSYIVLAVVLIGVIVGATLGLRKAGAFIEVTYLEDDETQMESAEYAGSTATTEESMILSSPEAATTTVKSDEELLDEIVEASISTMSIEDKVAGLFFITPESLTGYESVTQAGDATKEALGTYPVGGLIYFADNIQDEQQVRDLISGTEMYSKFPLFFGIDEEGGVVARIGKSGIDVPIVGDMGTVGASGDSSKAYEAGSTIGTYLTDLGFNVDFAPVADVILDPSNTTIGNRSFGEDPTLDGEMVGQYVNGLQEKGVSACVKHFPGLGDTTTDTHTGMATTERTLDEMRTGDFLSFKGGIDSSTDMVMVSHVSAPNVNGDDTPCSLSKTMITDELRGELQYDGVVITDALNMQAITDRYTPAEAAVAAINAGADMLLMPADFKAAYEGVIAAVADGTISEDRINESLSRIYRIKKRDSISTAQE